MLGAFETNTTKLTSLLFDAKISDMPANGILAKLPFTLLFEVQLVIKKTKQKPDY